MSKTVDIEYCGDCPHRFYKGNDMACDKTDKLTAENAPIPSWCPLPDTQEQGRSKTGANITKCGHGTPSYTACRACQVEVSKIEIDAYMSAQENKP